MWPQVYRVFSLSILQDDYMSQNTKTLWIDMAVHLRFLHVIRQIPAYLLLFLYPVYSQCCPWSRPVRTIYYHVSAASIGC